MAYVFVHLIVGWVLGTLYEFTSATSLGYYGWLFLLAGAVLPDIDLFVDWIFGLHTHRTLTHSVLFTGIMAVLSYLVLNIVASFNLLESENHLMLAVILGIGMGIHSLTDIFYGVGVPLLWPSKWYFSFFKGINYAPTIGGLTGDLEYMKMNIKRIVLDMGLGAFWFFYLLLIGKIAF